MRSGLLLLLLLVLLPGGFSPVGADEPQREEAPPAPKEKDFRVYRHPEGYFALEYPGNWRVLPLSGPGKRTVTFVGPGEDVKDPRTVFSVLLVPLGRLEDRVRLAKELPRLVGRMREEVATRLDSGRLVASSECVVAGTRAVDQSYSHGGKQPGRGHVIGLVGPDALYFLILYAPETNWTALESVFERMRRRFSLVRARKVPADASLQGTGSYTDPEGAFTLELPRGWIASRRREGEIVEHTFVDPGGSTGKTGAAFVVLREPVQEAEGQVPFRRLVSALERNLRQREPGLVRMGQERATLGERQAVRIDYVLETADGPMRRRVWFVEDPEAIYILLGTVRAKDFDRQRSVFDTMAASLRFRTGR